MTNTAHTTEQHAARIFLSQARRPDLANTPRLYTRGPAGSFQPLLWSDLARDVERLCAVLIELGVDVDTRAAVLSDTRAEWGVAGLAIVAARGTLVPVYPSLTDESLVYVLSHSQTRVLFVEGQRDLERVMRLWPKLALEHMVAFDEVDHAAAAAASGVDEALVRERALSYSTSVGARGAALCARDPRLVEARLDRARGDDVAYMLYTSGTTGAPKGVPLTHDNVGSNGDDWVKINGPLIDEGDRDLLWLPMSHIFGWGEFCLGNQLAMQTYVSSPASVLDDLSEVRPHIFMAVPAYWEKLAKTAITTAGADASEDARRAELLRVTGGRLRFCLSGGAGLTRDIKDFFYSAGMLIIEGYGLTECSPTLTLNRPDDFDFDTVGKALPSVELVLADDGEILARGPNVFAGYYKDPEATAAAFDDDGWLHTGDLGRFTERGFLQIIGRKKEILVTAGGKNVPPANIELRFASDPLVSHLVVYGDGKKYLTALVDIDESAARALLGDEQSRLSRAQLRAAPALHAEIQARIDRVNNTLARYETVKAFVVAPEPFSVEDGLLTPSLKIKRKQIYARYAAQLDALYR
ncbi:MAG: long-chain fatty acid--CoA ligase [Myxococcales bacterium]|nr:long-chain fatty acid--CoA ligase [Myxococcales bacterium]